MLTIISPAKTLDFESKVPVVDFSIPLFLNDSKELIDILKQKSETEISSLMNVSNNIAKLNHDRYQKWSQPFTKNNARQSIFTFNGAVYKGFTLNTYSKNEFNLLQKNLRILSGLYGILKPFDLIQAYRLEMGTKLKNKKGKTLYEFWKEKVTNAIDKECKDVLVNLASKEYSDVVDMKKLRCKVVTPVFKEFKNGNYKVIAIHAKRARGLFADFMIKNNVKNVSELKKFSSEGYKYSPKDSSEGELVFLRKNH